MQKWIPKKIIEGTLDWKLSVFGPIYFPVSSYPVFVLRNNHSCLSVMQSLQYKNSCKDAFNREKHRPDQIKLGQSCR